MNSADDIRTPTRSMLPLLLFLTGLCIPLPVLSQYETHSVPIDGDPSLRLCMTCHGAYGQGNPAVGGPKLAGMEPWYLRSQLTSFRNGLRGNQRDYIPAFEMRDTVRGWSDEQINTIVMAISRWPDAGSSRTVAGDTARGQVLYQACAACHGMNGEGNESLGAPALAGRSDWYLLSQLKLYKSGYRGSHPEDTAGAQMRLMTRDLETVADMEAVIAYIATLNRS